MIPKMLILSYEILRLKGEIDKLESNYLLNLSVKRQIGNHSSSALLLFRNPREAMYDPRSAYCIWSYVILLLKREFDKLKYRYLPHPSVKRQNQTYSSSAPLLFRNPRKAICDPKNAYLELGDRAVEKIN